MIVVTGVAGFIGSCLISYLHSSFSEDLVGVDDFSKYSTTYIDTSKYYLLLDRDSVFSWIKKEYKHVSCIYHLGARTDTMEHNMRVFESLNIEYSKKLWELATHFDIPFIYASSAATYGLGEFGYEDRHSIIPKLKPLNAYGKSKHIFDKWVLTQEKSPSIWRGMKFFNVYGPNEYHKRKMASVIYHAYNQLKNGNTIKLFKSYKNTYAHGCQKRDFIYVKDVVKICVHLGIHTDTVYNGIYNVGTGKARTFIALAEAIFKTLQKKVNIDFVDMPSSIRDNYQYFTEANIDTLRCSGYKENFHSLEDGIKDYINAYLVSQTYY